MMIITTAIDSFKGSLSTFDSGKAVKEGIKRVFPDAEVLISPLADGGEGTVEAIVSASGGYLQKIAVCGPLGSTVTAEYGIIPETNTAVMEMSAAAGITLVKENDRNPLNTTTYGVGEMILDALNKGCRKFVMGIGGSATNDCGIGMLQALGFEFLDKEGNQVSRFGKGLESISEIRTENVDIRLKDAVFTIACDVTNPLCGKNGCSAIYGPQKGATPEIIEKMDGWMKSFAELSKTVNNNADPDFPGSGAAGGMGFAFRTFLRGELKSGIDIVIRQTGLEDKIRKSDFVITGEGRLDGQSAMGKAPIGVAKLAKKYGKPVFAFSGCVTDDAKKCNEYGIDAFFPILKAPVSLAEAMDIENAYKNLSDTAEQVFRIVRLLKNS